MTPQITIIALALIAAALSVIAAFQRAYINSLKADATYRRFKAEQELERMDELLAEARAEAKTEYDLRRQAERNLQTANRDRDSWQTCAQSSERLLSNYSRPRDPKTGRFYSAKPRPTAKEMEQGLDAFDAMMGNAIDQLQGLTVRKLCDEVRENANAGI